MRAQMGQSRLQNWCAVVTLPTTRLSKHHRGIGYAFTILEDSEHPYSGCNQRRTGRSCTRGGSTGRLRICLWRTETSREGGRSRGPSCSRMLLWEEGHDDKDESEAHCKLLMTTG